MAARLARLRTLIPSKRSPVISSYARHLSAAPRVSGRLASIVFWMPGYRERHIWYV
jgi:hypothetical protein